MCLFLFSSNVHFKKWITEITEDYYEFFWCANNCNTSVPFNDRESPYIGSHSFGHNSPGDWAIELSKPSTDSTSLRLEIERKRFSLSVSGSVGVRCKWGYFVFFWPPLPGPGPQPIRRSFWLKIFLETRAKSASLEPLNDFLAYL